MSVENFFPYQLGVYPPPESVLKAALAMINNDGSVDDFDKVEQAPLRWVPENPIPLDEFPKDVYETHLLHVARAIYGTVSSLASRPQGADRVIRNLAIYLQYYQHDYDFLQKAIFLGHVDERGFMQPPQLDLIA